MGTNKEKVNAAAKEIAQFVNEKMEKSQLDWKNNTLTPLIDEKIKDIFGSVEADVAKFFNEIDSIQVELSGQKAIKPNDVPTWQRVAGVVGGLAVGDIGIAMAGGINGLSKDLAKSIGIELGAGFVLGLLGLLNPITLIATIVGVGIFNIGKGNKRALNNIKSSVSSEIVNQLNSKKEESISNINASASAHFEKLSKTITNAVDIEIKEVEEQIQATMNELEKGQSNIDERKKELNECENQVKQLIAKTDDFVMDLLG